MGWDWDICLGLFLEHLMVLIMHKSVEKMSNLPKYLDNFTLNFSLKKITEWGVPPPSPPIADGFFLKTNGKKLAERGGTPPHSGRKK